MSDGLLNGLADIAATDIAAAIMRPERPAFEPGVFYGMPADDYHKVEAAGSGGVKKLLQSPQHFKEERDRAKPPTDAMQFGTVVHTGVLEPHLIEQVCIRAPADLKKPTSAQFNAKKPSPESVEQIAAWREFERESLGKIVLSATEYSRALACVAAVRLHPGAMQLLEGGKREVSLFWRDAQYGCPCKARIDTLNHGGMIDLKTTTDASKGAFARQAFNLGYHVQAAHYISGGEHVLDATPEFFAFICVESEPPHAVACYVLESADILAGRRLADLALERYARALETGQWVGYPDTIERLVLPKWARTFDL